MQSHQTIYALTVQKNGTTVGTYTPNSAAKTINIQDVASAQTLSDLKTWIESMFEKDTTSVSGQTLIKAKFSLYSEGEITAGGVGSGGSGGTGALYTCADVTAYNNSKVGRSTTEGAQVGDLLAYDGTHWHAVVAPATGVTKLINRTGEITQAQLRSDLGLGSAAYTNSSAYATATQGSHGETAYGWGNHASVGYLTGPTISKKISSASIKPPA